MGHTALHCLGRFQGSECAFQCIWRNQDIHKVGAESLGLRVEGLGLRAEEIGSIFSPKPHRPSAPKALDHGSLHDDQGDVVIHGVPVREASHRVKNAISQVMGIKVGMSGNHLFQSIVSEDPAL